MEQGANGVVAPKGLVWAAFAAIYLIWGSTYYFIREALDGFTPMLLGGLRFVTAGVLMLTWCALRGIPMRPGPVGLKHASITGLTLLLFGNGCVVWAEQVLPSGVVAIMVAIVPLFMVLLDRSNWNSNLRSPTTILGVLGGFAGVLLLFSDRMGAPEPGVDRGAEMAGLGLLVFCSLSWASGSLYAKHRPSPLPAVSSTGWQMLVGGVLFLIVATVRGEWSAMKWDAVPSHAWFGLAYLMLFGSIVAFTAYVWLLSVRPATQVSTYAYVNPVVAVLLGASLAHEHITARELIGLGVILGSVLLINLAKYRSSRSA
ncbi:MAG TPA: EamA family transporter [Flavobacteriales bacterium]|jgi:drug/metabolite transporter (DMT)-like permease|nr:EamA family transporter [Flavobacteriales bacterium]